MNDRKERQMTIAELIVNSLMKAKERMKIFHSETRFYLGDKNYQCSNFMKEQLIQQLSSKVTLISP